MGSTAELSGPDLGVGISDADLRDGAPLLGHANGAAIILVRDGRAVHALGAMCTHYGSSLAEGIVRDGTIRCPWHHACFDLATGKGHGPAITPVACYDVAIEGGRIRVGAMRNVVPLPEVSPASVVIVGGGAAGVACAEALRREGHKGTITLVTAEGTDPVDRPNLSKDYLAGSAPEEWVFLRTRAALEAIGVDVVDDPAAALDPKQRTVTTKRGRELPYDAVLLATGAEAIRLPIEGANLPHVHTLRTLTDSRAIAAAAKGPVVVIGASFIGLEAAASLRARGAEVTIVEPEPVPLARVLGKDVGTFVRRVHESKGVVFELGRKPSKITAEAVILDDGRFLPAALVVMGVGVKPRLDLASAAGLTIERGVVVDAQLRAAAGVWAAGDIARYPWNGEMVRIEHWQVAVRHGQAAARSMLGRPWRADVPYFWSQHHDVTLGYVGHAEAFDLPEIHGDLDARDVHVVYRDKGVIRAVVTIGRDKLALEVEVAMERNDSAALEQAVR